MRTFERFLVGLSCLVAGLVMVGSILDNAHADSPGNAPEAGPIYSISCNTGGLASVASTSRVVRGYLEGIYLDLQGTAGASINVTIATVAGGDIGVSRTLYSNSAYTNLLDGYYSLRQQAKDNTGAAISGVYGPYPLLGDKVYVAVTNASTTGVTFRAVLAVSE